jgi:hypothetical protein
VHLSRVRIRRPTHLIVKAVLGWNAFSGSLLPKSVVFVGVNLLVTREGALHLVIQVAQAAVFCF